MKAKRIIRGCFSQALLCVLLTSCAGSISLKEDNDFFGKLKNHDQHYTQGLEIKHTSEDGTQELSAAQKIYTPRRKQITELIKNDRPYAGVLFGRIGLVERTSDSTISSGLKFGIIGPHAFGKEAQNETHRLIKQKTAKGWDNQLSDELVLGYDVRESYTGLNEAIQGYHVKTESFQGVELGNLLTAYYAGSRASVSKEIRSFTLGVFAESTGTIKGWDATLDGNLYRESHSVKKKYLVAEIQAGIRVDYKKISIEFIYKLVTKEFEQQEREDSFGTVNIGYGKKW